MDIDQLAKYFSQICGILALLGLVLYLPLKPHWSKRFSFFDAGLARLRFICTSLSSALREWR